MKADINSVSLIYSEHHISFPEREKRNENVFSL